MGVWILGVRFWSSWVKMFDIRQYMYIYFHFPMHFYIRHYIVVHVTKNDILVIQNKNKRFPIPATKLELNRSQNKITGNLVDVFEKVDGILFDTDYLLPVSDLTTTIQINESQMNPFDRFTSQEQCENLFVLPMPKSMFHRR